MSYPLKIFLSYARQPNDLEFTRELSARLRCRGHEVWLDEERIAASQNAQKEVQKGINWCDHAVFVVSQEWLRRDWTTFELRYFADNKPNSRRLAVLRCKKEECQLPPQLINVTNFEWLKNSRDDDDIGYWQLLCGLEGRVPGPKSEWLAKGGEIGRPIPRSSSSIEVQAKLLGHFQEGDLRALRCDRTKQWDQLDFRITKQKGHEAIFLPGRRGEGHQYFMLRVNTGLRDSPPRRIVHVSWRRASGPPSIKQDYMGALASSLGCDTEELESTLNQELEQRNLIILHPCVREKFEDKSFLKYYSDWLPDLLARVKSPKVVKAIQPIEWPRNNWITRLVARFIHGANPNSYWAGQALLPNTARNFLNQIKNKSRDQYQIYILPDLTSITRIHVAEFCQMLGMSEDRTKKFIEQVMAGSENSEQILKGLADYLPEDDTN